MLEAAYDATLEGWAGALELRDHETLGHSRRVTELTVRLGREFDLSEFELTNLRSQSLSYPRSNPTGCRALSRYSSKPGSRQKQSSSCLPQAWAHENIISAVGLAFQRSAWDTACWEIDKRSASSFWVRPATQVSIS